jgi:hypothetical protein
MPSGRRLDGSLGVCPAAMVGAPLPFPIASSPRPGGLPSVPCSLRSGSLEASVRRDQVAGWPRILRVLVRSSLSP